MHVLKFFAYIADVSDNDEHFGFKKINDHDRQCQMQSNGAHGWVNQACVRW